MKNFQEANGRNNEDCGGNSQNEIKRILDVTVGHFQEPIWAKRWDGDQISGDKEGLEREETEIMNFIYIYIFFKRQ